jgi:hypothetical protein
LARFGEDVRHHAPICHLSNIAKDYTSLEGCCAAVAGALNTYAEAERSAQLIVAAVTDQSRDQYHEVENLVNHGRSIVCDAADACESVILAQIAALPKLSVPMDGEEDPLPDAYGDLGKIPGFQDLLNRDLSIIYPGADLWQGKVPLQSPPPQIDPANIDALIDWARVHALDSSGDLNGKDTNCTNFVSEALRAAGMQQTRDWKSDEGPLNDHLHQLGYGPGMSRDWSLAGGHYSSTTARHASKSRTPSLAIYCSSRSLRTATAVIRSSTRPLSPGSARTARSNCRSTAVGSSTPTWASGLRRSTMHTPSHRSGTAATAR